MEYKKKEGFTLIEMIVATVLFLIAITASIGIFLSTVNANKKVNSMHKVENEIRYIIEIISKETRLGTIYYDFYEEYYPNNFENPISILALRDNADNISYFALDGDGESLGVVQMTLDDGVTWSDLNTDSVVDSLDFYLLPDSDPFAQDVEGNIEQPMVIMYLQAHYSEGSVLDGQIRIQTTISSRQYKK